MEKPTIHPDYPPVPWEILRLAQRNTIVASGLSGWECGALSWDQMLMACVKALVAQNDRLMRELLEAARNAPDIHELKEREAK